MKARDIIRGWPRGKSTSGPSLISNVFVLWMIEPWSPRDILALAEEWEYDRRYHEAQQTMVDYYRSGGFSPFEPIARFYEVKSPRA